jgi:hypothetical protein
MNAFAANISPEGIVQLISDYFRTHGELNVLVEIDNDNKFIDITRPEGVSLRFPLPTRTTVNYSNLSRPPGI